MNQRTIRALVSLLITLLMLWPVVTGNRPLLLERFELDLYDWRLKKTLPRTVDPRIVVVDIDEKSMSAEGRWPWERQKLAEMLKQLFERYQIAVLGFDVVFSEPDSALHPEKILQELSLSKNYSQQELERVLEQLNPDKVFSQALSQGTVVMGYPFDRNRVRHVVGSAGQPLTVVGGDLSGLPIPEPTGVIGNLESLQSSTPYSGFFDNPMVDLDGVYRRVPLLQRYEGGYYPSLPLAMLMALFYEDKVEVSIEEDVTRNHKALVSLSVAGTPIPVDQYGAVLVPYRGPQGSFPYVSATDVIHGKVDPKVLEGAIVFLGTTAAGLLDLRVTPMSNQYAGVEVHANILSGMLDQTIKQRPDFTVAVELVQLIISAVVISFGVSRLSVMWGTVLTATWISGLITINLYAWSELSWVIPLGHTLTLIGLLFLFQQTTGYFFESRNKAHLASLFGQYIPPEIVTELSQQGAEIGLEGQSREMTVFFSDIRGFTGLSEALTPQQLTKMMNIYLTHMTAVIHKHRGTIDKYIGDAVMAFWGAPLDEPAHAELALKAALEMQVALVAVNKELQQEGLPEVAVGMGLNTGVMSVGNMGSSFRMAYTVMGDAVNLGSRLEGLTKFYGVPILLSEDVAKSVQGFAFKEIDLVRVKGRSEPVKIYQPIGPEQEVDAEVLQDITEFHQAFSDFRKANWSDAALRLQQLAKKPEHKILADVYLERIEHLKDQDLDENWDGVFSHTTK